MCDDYQLIVFYGFRVIIPADVDRRSYQNDLYDLQAALPEPFQVISLLSSVPMYGTNTDEEYDRLDSLATLWVGFVPTNPEQTLQWSIELREFITDTVLFEGIDFEKEPSFQCGVEWYIDDDSDAEEDQEEDQDLEKEEDEEENDSDEQEEEEEEDSDDEEDDDDDEQDSDEYDEQDKN